MNKRKVKLVADIGGTNIRIATATSEAVLANITLYSCRDYIGLEQVLREYITEYNLGDYSIDACLAIACPVENDLIKMTNLPWSFSQKKLQDDLQINKLSFINDYTAIAYAVPLLSAQQKYQIGGGKVVNNEPISICGPGTGLGVAHLIPASDNQWVSTNGEGGHLDFAPVDDIEIDILCYLRSIYGRVSYEQLLSGIGLEQIYQALSHREGIKALDYTAADISSYALAGSCKLCIQSLVVFFRVLGSFAGNLALMMGSFGGVYIAGGIVPRLLSFLSDSDFRKRFDAKGRFSDFNSDIPTFVITEQHPGILGASAYLHQSH